eukprot:TRINITY_DN21239_c0_g3_i1.p1 TRINITY_DN21239_c0_g3~~TRINITY_DN21239_c0_g3_i1.p1  ORF type:complete len:959 (+),score=254.44 TRINITY_DN21239_c0_g3_i1:276-2879(+)
MPADAAKMLVNLRNMLENTSCDSCKLNKSLDFLDIAPRLEMRLEAPEWVMTQDLEQMAEDLRRVGEIGASGNIDAEYELFCLAGSHLDQVVVNEDIVSARWYAAFLRGLYQRHQLELYKAVQEGLGPAAQRPEAFVYRTTAKGFERLCEKILEAIKEMGLEMQSRPGFSEAKEVVEDKRKFENVDSQLLVEGQAADVVRKELPQREIKTRKEHVQTVVRMSGNFICDISGCSFIAKDAQELKAAYENLIRPRPKMTCVRVKNGFAKCLPGQGVYRDLKVWMEMETPEGPLIAEVQLHLKQFYEQKSWTHLPYVVRRGSYDWQHLRAKLTAALDDVARKNARVGLKNAMHHKDMLMLRDAIAVARACHLDEALVASATKLLSDLEAQNKEFAKLREELRRAVAEKDVQMLSNAVDGARDASLPERELEEPERLLRQLLALEAIEDAKFKVMLEDLKIAIQDARDAGVDEATIREAEECIPRFEAIYKMREAVASNKAYLLKKAIQGAREIGADEAEIRLAEHHFACLLARESCKVACDQRDSRKLHIAIAEAEAAGMDPREEPEFERARTLLPQLESRQSLLGVNRSAKALLPEIRATPFSMDPPSEELMQLADKFREAIVHAEQASFDGHEVADSKKVLNELEARIDVLRSASATDEDGLEKAIRRAKSAGVGEEFVKAAEHAKGQIAALVKLNRAMDGEDILAIRTALGMCMQAHVPEDKMAPAQQKVAQGDAWKKLREAIEEEDAEDLHIAMERGVAAGIERGDMLDAAQDLMKKVAAKEAIDEAVKEKNIEALTEAIERARDAGADREVREAQKKLQLLVAEEELRRCMAGTDTKALKAAMAKATKAGVSEAVMTKARISFQKM